MYKNILLILFSLIMFGCKKEEPINPQSPSKFSSEQISAHYPNDLGAATVDVSAYPAQIQENYKLFLAVCSSCHSSARPLNASYVKAYDWKRFVKRMHVKMGIGGHVLQPKEEKKIVEFLVYDSKIRKIDHEAEFNAQRASLLKLFEEVSKERDRLVLDETKNLPKKETPYVGVK